MRRMGFFTRRSQSVLRFAGLLFAGLLLSAVAPSAANDPQEEKQVRAVLDTWAKASVKRDVATLDKVLHPDLMLGHTNGIEVESKEEVLKNAPNYPDWDPIELDIRSVRIYGNVALVKSLMAYRLRGAKQNNGDRNAMFVLVKDAQGWRIVDRHPIALRRAAAPPQ